MMAKEVMNGYINQTPQQNCRMFEELDKQRKGTYFYPWWLKAREKLKEVTASEKNG